MFQVTWLVLDNQCNISEQSNYYALKFAYDSLCFGRQIVVASTLWDGFKYAYHPAAPGSNPKHTTFQFVLLKLKL